LSALSAAGGTSLLAGCNDGQDTSQAEVVDWADKTFVTAEYADANVVNYNPFDPLYFPSQSPWYLFGQLFHESRMTNEFLPALATGWEKDGADVTVDLDDRFTWHDGDPIDAHDVVANYTIFRLVEHQMWDRVLVDVWAKDDYTVGFEVYENANENLMSPVIGGTVIAAKEDLYERFLPDDGSRGKEAEDWYEEELEAFDQRALRSEAQNLQAVLAPGETSDDSNEIQVIGWGPWKLKRMDSRTITFERWEDHVFADRINFPEIKWETFTDEQSRYQALLSGELSGSDTTITQTVLDQVPDHYSYYTVNSRGGRGVAMNYESFPDHRVRKAIAYAIDIERAVTNGGGAFEEPHHRDSGYYGSTDQHDKFLGDGWVEENLVQYEQNQDRADELLVDAGWTKEGDQWHDDDGNPATIDIRVPGAWSEWIQIGTTIRDILNNFGFDVTFETQELVVYYAQTMPQSKYDLAAWWLGGVGRPYPWYSYNVVWNALETLADEHNHPETYEEVPMPVGDPDGSPEQISFPGLLTQIAKTTVYDQNDEVRDEMRELYRKIAWTYNQMLPVYALSDSFTTVFIDERNFTTPDPEESPELHTGRRTPLAYMNQRGLVKAVERQ
jgi:peptide/nickel transport system substrate-binding protein